MPGFEVPPAALVAADGGAPAAANVAVEVFLTGESFAGELSERCAPAFRQVNCHVGLVIIHGVALV